MARNKRSVERFTEITAVLASEGPTGVREMADQLDAPSSTVHGYLQSMAEAGWVVNEDGTYRVSCKFMDVGSVATEPFRITEGHEVLERLAERSGYTTYMAVEERGYGVVVDKRKRNLAGNGPPLGGQHDLKQTAVGKAILAHASEQLLNEVYAPGYVDVYGQIHRDRWMEGFRPVPRSALETELAAIREQGYATSGLNPGVWSIAAPVIVGEELLGAVGLSSPVAEISEEYYDETAPDLVREAAAEIESSVG
jgi:DNA-binding IclR family transcriptional regulator